LKKEHNPNRAGTICSNPSPPITPLADVATSSGTSTPQLAFMTSNGYQGEMHRRRTPTALTVKDSIIIINVLSYRNKSSHRCLAQIFGILDHHRIIIDLIMTSDKSVSLAISSREKTTAITQAAQELEKLGTVSLKGLSGT